MLSVLYNTYNSFVTFIKTPYGRFVFTLISVFSILVGRLLFLFFPDYRFLILCFSVVFFISLWNQRHDVIERLLNNFIFQYFFFFCLQQENLLYSQRGIKGNLFLFCYFVSLIYFPASCFHLWGLDPFVWYSILLLVYVIYLKLQNLFVYPSEDFQREGSLEVIKDPSDYTWSFVTRNMNIMAAKWIHKPVFNRVNTVSSRYPLYDIGVRYMRGSGIGGAIADIFKNQPKLAGFAVTAGLTGFAANSVKEYKIEIHRIDSENAAKVKLEETKGHAQIKAEEAKGQAQIKIAQINCQKEIDVEKAKAQAQIKIAEINSDYKVNSQSWSQFFGFGKSNPPPPSPPVQAPSIFVGSKPFNSVIEKLSGLIDFVVHIFS